MFDYKDYERPYVVFRGKKGLKLIKQILNTPPTDPKVKEKILQGLREQEKRILQARKERENKE